MEKTSIKHLFFAGILLMYISVLSSCSKSGTNPTNATAGSFTWVIGGITYNADNDTAFVQGPYTLIAKKDESSPGNFKIFEIDLSGFATGPYTLTATGVNQVNYITSSSIITSQSGTLNITSNTGTTISGNFTTTLTGGAAMTGNFSNVPVKP